MLTDVKYFHVRSFRKRFEYSGLHLETAQTCSLKGQEDGENGESKWIDLLGRSFQNQLELDFRSLMLSAFKTARGRLLVIPKGRLKRIESR